MTTKPVLAYWDIRGKAQPIRCLLAYLEIDYENKIYVYNRVPPFHLAEDWRKDKFNLRLDFPNLPYWIDGDLRLTESMAILRHIARQNDSSLIPIGPQIEMVENFLLDVWHELSGLVYDYSEERAKEFEVNQKPLLAQLSKYLGTKKWLMGEKITYVDFLFYEVLYRQNKYKSSTITPFPNFVQLKANFEAIPAIAKFMAFPDYIKSPCCGAKALLKDF